jgi:hypothetical protein
MVSQTFRLKGRLLEGSKVTRCPTIQDDEVTAAAILLWGPINACQFNQCVF